MCGKWLVDQQGRVSLMAGGAPSRRRAAVSEPVVESLAAKVAELARLTAEVDR
ncbi:hypothetical protein [Nocardia sp. alder85J]|uniref:hypothetical protein n=1 Tax=Nocardia sp. alder85J TaxID=2862949 RepID=UPI001CD41348|nr:hypothetical protein [Nocardia sp. alder85J]MCX4091230.1 hypothetical protein [Nocardia sp. alder85J]